MPLRDEFAQTAWGLARRVLIGLVAVKTHQVAFAEVGEKHATHRGAGCRKAATDMDDACKAHMAGNTQHVEDEASIAYTQMRRPVRPVAEFFEFRQGHFDQLAGRKIAVAKAQNRRAERVAPCLRVVQKVTLLGECVDGAKRCGSRRLKSTSYVGECHFTVFRRERLQRL